MDLLKSKYDYTDRYKENSMDKNQELLKSR